MQRSCRNDIVDGSGAESSDRSGGQNFDYTRVVLLPPTILRSGSFYSLLAGVLLLLLPLALPGRLFGSLDEFP